MEPRDGVDGAGDRGIPSSADHSASGSRRASPVHGPSDHGRTLSRDAALPESVLALARSSERERRASHGHRRSSSLTSPPPPPADFNPPADFTYSNPIHGIETPAPATPTPVTPTTHTPTTHTPIPCSPSRPLPDLEEELTISTATAVTGAGSPAGLVPSLASPRPPTRITQHVSSDSVTVSNNSSGSVSSTAGTASSDGSDVLATRRDELVTQILASDSAESSRQPSASSSPTGDAAAFTAQTAPQPQQQGQSSQIPSHPSVEINVINPTPRSSSAGLVGSLGVEVEVDDEPPARGAVGTPDLTGQAEGQQQRPRSLSRGSDEATTVAAHAWDSVWPAANVGPHRNLSPKIAPLRFPLAPMSPYHTPSFSPSVLQTSRRISTSPPPSSPLPLGFVVEAAERQPAGGAGGTTRTVFTQARGATSIMQSQPQAPSGLAAAISISGSSGRPDRTETDSFHDASDIPPIIPQWLTTAQATQATQATYTAQATEGQAGDSKSPLPPGSPAAPDTPVAPTAPATQSPAPTPLPAAPGSPGGPRASQQPLGTSPPPLTSQPPPSTSRRSPASFINQFPELAPPFISRRELFTQSRLTRRLSETAILRRPDVPLALDRLVLAPQINRPLAYDLLADEVDMSRVETLAHPSSAASERPHARRASSAQDTRTTIHTSLQRLSPLEKPPSFEPFPRLSAAPADGPSSSSPSSRFPSSPGHRTVPGTTFPENSMFEMDESPIEDDDEDRVNPPPSGLGYPPTPNQGGGGAIGGTFGDAHQPPPASGGGALHGPSALPQPSSPPLRPATYAAVAAGRVDDFEATPTPLGASLVDEGDMLPQGHSAIAEVDVTFDDEGLNTLERIFLLSRSEYAFHRAYVARVLGDLLSDVDPCESVEYVLPLVSGFSLDEDDTVKEAFATDLHRILWYFFSTCQLVKDESEFDELDDEEEAYEMSVGEAPEGTEKSPRRPSLSCSNPSSPGVLPESVYQLENVLMTPSIEMSQSPMSMDEGNTLAGSFPSTTTSTEPRSTVDSSASTVVSHFEGSSTAHEMSTPETSMDSQMGEYEPLGGTGDDKLWPISGAAEHVEPPILAVDFFRPLLGTLLLSQNPAISDPVRVGIVSIISRLRGCSEPSVDTWGAHVGEPKEVEKQVFLSQTGPHNHDIRPFEESARALVEHELLHGIVLGMGKLSTDVPESFFDNAVELMDRRDIEAYEGDEELFRQQMIHEATLGRALSLSFIGSVCEFYSPEEVERYGFVDEVVRGRDSDATTRAEAALAMTYVAKSAPASAVDRLLPVFESFVHDESQQVRQSACVCFPALCRRLTDDAERRRFAVDTMLSFMSGGEDVRLAALEVLGEVIYTFDKDPLGPPHELLEIYVDDQDANGFDCDWDILASFNFPGVCLTLGPDRWDALRPLFKRLVSRCGDRVLRTIAAFLHELAQILRPDQVAADVLPVYRRCLEAHDEIRERIFEHVDIILAALPPEIGWTCFRDLQAAWANDTLGGWRAREQLALHIPSFLETFSANDEVSAVLDMMRSALLDRFAAVRDAATIAVPKSYEILGHSRCSNTKLHDMLLDLCMSSRYRERLTFVRCLREFIRPPPNRKAFETYFVPALPSLSQDIVDVRLGLANAISDLFVVGAFYGDRKIPVPTVIRHLASVLAEDDSADVRDVITRIGADRWQDQPADEALSEAAKKTDTPSSMESAIQDALSESPMEDQKVPVHARATIPSPVEGQRLSLEDVEEQGSNGSTDGSTDAALKTVGSTGDTRNPFEASFERAAEEDAIMSVCSGSSRSVSSRSGSESGRSEKGKSGSGAEGSGS